MRSMKKLAQKGFTLIELMIVVAIIGILAAVAIPMFMDSMKKAKKSEALIQLNKIGKSAKEHYITNSSFPTDAAPLTPSTACSTGPGGNCTVTPADWAVTGWQALDFQMDEPFKFQYQYTGAASTFTALAVGDLDNDNTMITYTAAGTATGGNPAVTYTAPLPNTD